MDAWTPLTIVSIGTHVHPAAERHSSGLGERSETESYTYTELRNEVTALAAGLRSFGIGEGDRVVLYSTIRADADEFTGTVVVTNRAGENSPIERGWRYRTLVAEQQGETVAPVARDAADPLFVCYTSAPESERTGMVHKTGEYLFYVAWTAHAVLDLEPGDTLWCPAGIEWITGHSYVVYGALTCGATTVLGQGVPVGTDHSRP